MLARKTYFIREHVGFMKLTDTYDILDPETQDHLGIAKEKPGGFMKLLRLFINKRVLPTKVFVYEGSDPQDESKLQFSIQRGFTLFRSKVDVLGPDGALVGWFKSKVWTIGATFRVFDLDGHEVALVKGDWKGWNFRFLDADENELGTITKKWAGIGKELFTSADNYMISLNAESEPNHAMLLLAAGLAIDTIYKEK